VSLPVPAGGDLVGWLQTVAVCRLVEVPRPPVDAEPGAGRLQRDAAVVSAYHGAVAGGGVPLLAGWCRRRGDGPVDVLLGGAVLDRLGDAEASLGLPPGGRGTPRAPGAGFAEFSALALGRPRYPGVTPRWPTLGDLQRTAETMVDEVGYGPEVAANVRGFIRVRLASLRLGTPGRFFDGGHTLDMEALLGRNVVLEIDDVGDRDD
jgi:hypothetical protein